MAPLPGKRFRETYFLQKHSSKLGNICLCCCMHTCVCACMCGIVHVYTCTCMQLKLRVKNRCSKRSGSNVIKVQNVYAYFKELVDVHVHAYYTMNQHLCAGV